MKIRVILIAIMVAISSAGALAQSKAKLNAAHLKAHKDLLANANYRMDKRVLKDFIKNDLKPAKESATAAAVSANDRMLDDLLKEAHKHIGKRYSAGSKGPNRFDCSGFSSYVYRQFGYELSPSSRAQFTQGEPVERNELRKGDLVFFTSRRSGGAVGHVGIVVSADNETGNFKFIHAATSKGITVSDYSGYYVGRYLGARRVITDDVE